MIKINNITLTFFPLDLECVKNLFTKALGREFRVCYAADNNDSLYNYYVQQYNAPERRFILFSPKSNPRTTIMYANIQDGYTFLIKFVSKSCDLEYYSIVLSDGTSFGLQGYHFHHYAPNKVRHILCYQDPKWVFYEEGKPLWFENTEYYTQRLKKKRLNKEIITEYLRSLGWNIDQEDFWMPLNGFYEFSNQV